jgi:hypothetical protein
MRETYSLFFYQYIYNKKYSTFHICVDTVEYEEPLFHFEEAYLPLFAFVTFSPFLFSSMLRP